MDVRPLREILADKAHGNLPDAVHSELETDLQQGSSARLRRLKECRNTLSSAIYCLQPEILSRIFFVYAQENDELFNLRWTRLLLVCRRWHDIGKNTQSLWSFIDVNFSRNRYGPVDGFRNLEELDARDVIRDVIRHMDELDARDVRRIDAQRMQAGLSSLTIRMHMDSDTPSEVKLAYTTMFWEPHCLSSLDAGGHQSSVVSIIHSMATHRHAYLRALKLTCYVGFPSDSSKRLDTQTSMNMLLENNVPNLQHLSLSGIPIDFTLLHGLRSLRVSHQYVSLSRITLQDIVGALARCPKLEVLYIVLPPDFHPDDTISPVPATMMHLSAIAVRTTTLLCTYLLQALESVPKSSKLLASTTDNANALSMSALTSYMGSYASDETSPSIRSIAITLAPVPVPGPARTQLSILGQRWPSRSTSHALFHWFFKYDPDDDSENTYLGFDAVILETAQDEVLSHVLHAWPLSQATHLDVRLLDMTTSHLDVLLASLPALTTVIVEPASFSAQILIATLHTHLHEHGRRAVAHIVFDTSMLNHKVRARQSLTRVLTYCAEAARAGVPLDTLEIVKEPQESSQRIIDPTEEIEWSEWYRDLAVGFVYEGVLHSSRQDLDGTKWDSFALADVIV